MVYQIFFSPQVKRSVIISNQHGKYELPHEFPNDLNGIFADVGTLCPHNKKKKQKKTWDLRKLVNIRKTSKLHKIMAQCPVFLPK